MAIPVQTAILWRALTAFGGAGLMQLPAEQVAAARERRRKLIALPGATVIVGRPHPEVHAVDKRALAEDGREIPIRVYRPRQAIDARLPMVVNFHGGGFVSGDPRQSEWWCSHLAHDASVVVASVDYRLAPEDPYPAAPEDCFAATAWTAAHAADLGGDGTRLAVMGDSAGGNLAAVVCLMARDRGGPRIALQVLIYPGVEHLDSFPSEDENEFAPMLGKADLQVHRLYCAGHETEPYAAPLRADHSGLPPALIQTAQHDPLRDQGAAYAEALRRAGVDVRLTNYVDAVHGYVSIPGAVPAARQALAEVVDAVRSAWGAAGPGFPGSDASGVG